MKAYVLEEYNKPFILKKIPDPLCGDNDVVVRVLYAGICGTDMKIYHGHLDGIIRLPHIQGHEVAGEIVETGKNVETLKPGDRGIVYHYIVCRDCEFCRTGRENICSNIKRTGFELNGGFAEYMSIPSYNFCKIDTDISMSNLSIVPDAILTPYHSIKTLADLKVSQKILIIGLGGLGLHGIQIAKMMGAFVAGVDIRPESLVAGRKLGAEKIINPEKEDLVKSVMEWTGGMGVDVIIDGVGNAETFSTALNYLKKGGKLILMGYDPLNSIPLDAIGMHYNEWQIIGSRLGTKQELFEIMDHINNGKIEPLVLKIFEMDQINTIFSKSLINTISGRITLKGF